MGSGKRFCLFLFVLATVLSAGALTCAWFSVEPIAPAISAVKGSAWFNIALIVCLAIVAVGLVCILCRILFARRRHSYLETTNDAGPMLVSRSVIEHTVERTVTAFPSVQFINARARLTSSKRHGCIISVRIAPHGLVSLGTVGPALQAAIKSDVEHLLGSEVDKVVLDVRDSRADDVPDDIKLGTPFKDESIDGVQANDESADNDATPAENITADEASTTDATNYDAIADTQSDEDSCDVISGDDTAVLHPSSSDKSEQKHSSTLSLSKERR
jgi:hypothetical protein